ncbi:hypothetical protein KKD95_03190 [Patescibacteria group bacterium]|nr:hypothetical protein [Patescibacteria group bacterium]
MSGDKKDGKGGGHHGHSPAFWIILGIIIGGFAVLILTGSKLFAENNIPGTQATPRPGQASQHVSDATSCPTFSRTRNTCAFGKDGTLPIGSDEAGLYFVYSVPYGPDETYTRYRREGNRWVVWACEDEPGPVFAQRFVANGEEAAVEYWLTPNKADCPN